MSQKNEQQSEISQKDCKSQQSDQKNTVKKLKKYFYFDDLETNKEYKTDSVQDQNKNSNQQQINNQEIGIIVKNLDDVYFQKFNQTKIQFNMGNFNSIQKNSKGEYENLLQDDNKLLKKKQNCNCKKSSCQQNYCECFQNGLFCVNCNCQNCKNKFDYTKVEIKKQKKKINCNCRNQKCDKNYCQCKRQNQNCTENCNCIDCFNMKNEQKLEKIKKLYMKLNNEIINDKEKKEFFLQK